jgi:hypothetical protein
MSRELIVRILYVLITIEFISTLLLVPRSTGQTALLGATILAISMLCARMATAGRYAVPDIIDVPAVATA